jgi:K+/H+ antiporter YhaU regulatory subunit KhtT
MVSPVNGDKPISPSTERSGQSSKNLKSEQASALAPSMQSATTEPVSAIVEVDKARQLYELESQKTNALDSTITSSEEARSLLNKILDQFNRAPEQALLSQGARSSSALANLLQTAPA